MLPLSIVVFRTVFVLDGLDFFTDGNQLCFIGFEMFVYQLLTLCVCAIKLSSLKVYTNGLRSDIFFCIIDCTFQVKQVPIRCTIVFQRGNASIIIFQTLPIRISLAIERLFATVFRQLDLILVYFLCKEARKYLKKTLWKQSKLI